MKQVCLMGVTNCETRAAVLNFSICSVRFRITKFQQNTCLSVSVVTPLQDCHSSSSGHRHSFGVAGPGAGSVLLTPRGHTWPCLALFGQWVQWGWIWCKISGVGAKICASHPLKSVWRNELLWHWIYWLYWQGKFCSGARFFLLQGSLNF